MDLRRDPGIVDPAQAVLLANALDDLQVAQSLRAQTEDVEIDWVAAKAFAPLVRACTVVDHVYEFDRHGSLATFSKLCKEIRQKKYDWALDMQGLARSAMLLAAARATQKAAGKIAAKVRGCFARTRPICRRVGEIHTRWIFCCNFCPCWAAARNSQWSRWSFCTPKIRPGRRTWPLARRW